MFIGLIFIIFPLIENNIYFFPNKNRFILSLQYGGLFGLILYGVYNFTNITIFSNYNIITALIDTIWGSFAYFITVYMSLLIFNV
jgi:uncharacterized membrane protein